MEDGKDVTYKSIEMKPNQQLVVEEYCNRVLSTEARKVENCDKVINSFGEGVDNIVVIPSYNEDPESVRRLIDSIKASESISNTKVGIILVVNNNQSAAAGIVEKNKEVEDVFSNRTDRVVVIDKSSDPLPDDRSGVGPARNIGSAYASWYFLEHIKNGIITHTDADCEMPEDFISEQQKIYEDPSIDACTGPTRFKTDESNKLLEKSLEIDRMAGVYRFIVDKYLLASDQSISSKAVHTAGSNMSSRVVALATVNGIPELRGAEDVQFDENLSKEGFVISTNGPAIISEFRESARTSTGHGLGVSKTMSSLESGRYGVYVEPACVTKLKLDFRRVFGDMGNLSGNEQIKKIIGDEELVLDVVKVMEQRGIEIKGDRNTSVIEFLQSNPPVTVEVKDVIDEAWDIVFSNSKHSGELKTANRLVEKSLADQFSIDSPQISIISSVLTDSGNSQYDDVLGKIGISRKKIIDLANQKTDENTLGKSLYVYMELLKTNKFLRDSHERLRAEIKIGILYDFLKVEMNNS